MRDRCAVLAGLLCILGLHNAAGQGFLWAKQVGLRPTPAPPLPPIPSKIAADTAGNVYVIGSFTGVALFGTTNLTSAGDFDIFLAKYGPGGSLSWVLQAGGTSRDLGSDVAVDPAGNVYITGSFQGTASFGNTNLTAPGQNLFVAKYTSDGRQLWVQAGISGGQGLGITADADGNSYCTGGVGGAILIEKRDPYGYLLWHIEAPGAPTFGSGAGNAVKLDNSGNVFVAGSVFLTKLDPNGNFLWARQAGGGPVGALSLALDSAGGPLITGSFWSSIDFGVTNLTAICGTWSTGYVAKYDPDGNVLWALPLSPPEAAGYSAAIDAEDNAYVSGYESTAYGFLQKYDQNGNLLWGIYPAVAGHAVIYGMAAGAPGHTYAVITSTGNVWLDSFSYTNLLGGDLFVAEVAEQAPPGFLVGPRNSPPGLLGGSSYAFTSEVRSLYPVSFQWQFNGQLIPGATNTSLTITNAQAPDQGGYSVIASNQFGAATSTVATLTVYYTITVLTNGSGTVSMAPAPSRTADYWLCYPGNTLVTLTPNPGNAPFSSWSGDLAATNNPFSLIMTSNLFLLASFADSTTNIVLDDLDPRTTFFGAWNPGHYLVSRQMYELDFRIAPCATSATATVVFRPTITVPGYYDVSIWYPGSFMDSCNSWKAPWSIISERGTFSTNVNQRLNTGSWVLIGPGIYFAPGSDGFIALSNNTGEPASCAVVADAVRLIPSTSPIISSGPLDQTATAGNTATFSVSARGTPPLTYQWQFNGTNLVGATGSLLTISPVYLSNGGTYRALVTNFLGQALSSSAVLQVTPPPRSAFGAPQFGSNGQLQLTLTSVTGIALSIETSTNLMDWLTLAALTNTTGSVQFTNTINTNDAARFYRSQWIVQ